MRMTTAMLLGMWSEQSRGQKKLKLSQDLNGLRICVQSQSIWGNTSKVSVNTVTPETYVLEVETSLFPS